MAEKSTTFVSAIKEQFALLGILVVLIGTVYTDYYYASFGLRYQSLNLPASHILYRGLTVLRDAPYVVLPYLIAVLWLAFECDARSAWVIANRIRVSYAVFGLVLVFSYWLGSVAGRRAADRDLSSRSTLPKVIQLSGSGDEKSPCDVPESCRLLLIDGDYLYVFTPTGNTSSAPNVLRLDRKAFNEIITGTQ